MSLLNAKCFQQANGVIGHIFKTVRGVKFPVLQCCCDIGNPFIMKFGGEAYIPIVESDNEQPFFGEASEKISKGMPEHFGILLIADNRSVMPGNETARGLMAWAA